MTHSVRFATAQHAGKAEPCYNRVLVVEDSASIRGLLCSYLDAIEAIEPVPCGSLAEARTALGHDGSGFFCAVLDLNLPDAPNGEIVDLVHARDIPVVVLTGTVDRKVRLAMLEREVIDYVVKNNVTEIEHVANIVERLHANAEVDVLVVDDTRLFRRYLSELLKRYRYRIHMAENGRRALEVLRANPKISLVITDYQMPELDGQGLIQEIRRTHRREDLAIIGLSDATQHGLSAMLLKSGANDFLAKPFEVEEFFCRVTQNTDMVRYVRQVRDAANKDFLTKVANRRYLFDQGERLREQALKGRFTLAAALVDADHFKRINDTWGHQVGDLALKSLATTLSQSLGGENLVGRYGGEEFVCLAKLQQPAQAEALFERVRRKVEAIDLSVDGAQVPLSVSIGLTTRLEESFDAMLQRADEGVYRAKAEGRNRVVSI